MSVLDTSRIDAGRRESLEVAEAARQTEWQRPSFAGELFTGRVLTDLLAPCPSQDADDRAIGDLYLARVEAFLRSTVDPDAIDRTGEVPSEVIRGLVELGCFGLKIPKEYGGLGFSQINYNRVIALVASYCGSTAVWLSAHQSIGAPQPLLLFGTDEQKRRYLPRLATGALSAFALTEPDVGSDPAKMTTIATPTSDGQAYLLNGEKLWCTNGPVADVIVVMARLPSTMVEGRRRQQITAFIIEHSMPGIEVVHRCRFMGLHGIQNGLLRFRNVRVPKENILWGPGLGLKLALITLNAGRMTLPAACVGMAKQSLSVCRQWASRRHQWGAAIGKHEAVAAKIAEIAALTFAMESVVDTASLWLDHRQVDGRLEAAIAKLFCSEMSWWVVDQTLQIRGGRGYETADSLRGRGEPGVPVERIARDSRINLIIEGTSEIMRLFIAREALDAHMRVAGAVIHPKTSATERMAALARAAAHYATWYPRQWCAWSDWPRYHRWPLILAGHMRYVEQASHRLARNIFHAALRHRIALERRQQLLGRFVDIGMFLFAMVITCARAKHWQEQTPPNPTALSLADFFCRLARRRVEQTFDATNDNDDHCAYRLAQAVLENRMTWLEDGAVRQQW